MGDRETVIYLTMVENKKTDSILESAFKISLLRHQEE